MHNKPAPTSEDIKPKPEPTWPFSRPSTGETYCHELLGEIPITCELPASITCFMGPLSQPWMHGCTGCGTRIAGHIAAPFLPCGSSSLHGVPQLCLSVCQGPQVPPGELRHSSAPTRAVPRNNLI